MPGIFDVAKPRIAVPINEIHNALDDLGVFFPLCRARLRRPPKIEDFERGVQCLPSCQGTIFPVWQAHQRNPPARTPGDSLFLGGKIIPETRQQRSQGGPRGYPRWPGVDQPLDEERASVPVVFGGCVAYLIRKCSAVFAAMQIVEKPKVSPDWNISKTDALTYLVVNFPCAKCDSIERSPLESTEAHHRATARAAISFVIRPLRHHLRAGRRHYRGFSGRQDATRREQS